MLDFTFAAKAVLTRVYSLITHSHIRVHLINMYCTKFNIVSVTCVSVTCL